MPGRFSIASFSVPGTHNQMDDDKLIYPVFTSTKLQGEKKLDKVQIVLTPDDRKVLNEYKELINQDKEAMCFRVALHYSYNLLLNEFGGKIGAKLFIKRLPKNYGGLSK